MSLLSFVMPCMFGESVQGIKLLFSNSRMVQIPHCLSFSLLTWINRRFLCTVILLSCRWALWNLSPRSSDCCLWSVVLNFAVQQTTQWHYNQPTSSSWNALCGIQDAPPAEERSVRQGTPVAHQPAGSYLWCPSQGYPQHLIYHCLFIHLGGESHCEINFFFP